MAFLVRSTRDSLHSRRERSTAIHPDNRDDVQVLRDRAQQDSSEGTRPNYVGRPRQDTCPICLTDSSVFSVETNCGHLFCGKCIITFWKYRVNWMNGMTCPVCRQVVRRQHLRAKSRCSSTPSLGHRSTDMFHCGRGRVDGQRRRAVSNQRCDRLQSTILWCSSIGRNQRRLSSTPSIRFSHWSSFANICMTYQCSFLISFVKSSPLTLSAGRIERVS